MSWCGMSGRISISELDERFERHRDIGELTMQRALPILIEIVKTELELKNASVAAAKALHAWSMANGDGHPSETPLMNAVEASERVYLAAKAAHDAALAKVTL